MSMVNAISNKILAAGLVLTVCTQMRVEGLQLGPGEFLLVLWLVGFYTKYFFKGNFKFAQQELVLPLSMLGIIFFATIGLGVSGNINFSNILPLLHNYLAILLSFFLLVALIKKKDFVLVIRDVTLIGTCFFSFLLVLSLNGINNIGGIDLLYGNLRFSGGARNPNQLAVFITVIPLVSLLLMKEKILSKLLSTITIVASICIGLATLSDAILGSWIILLCLYIFINIILHEKNITKHKLQSVIKFVVGCCIVHRTWKKCHRVSCWTEGDDRAAGILWTLLSMPSWKV